MSFLTQFFEVSEGVCEKAVCCPFDHFTINGLPYKEHNPSAHINTLEYLFHCKVCQQGFNEVQFIQKLFGCSCLNARRIQRCFETPETLDMWEASTTLDSACKELALGLGISETVINDLKIRTVPGLGANIGYPVFMFDQIVDIRKYNPGGHPKVKSRSNCYTGFIIPFDLWRLSPPTTLTVICAGEKDMSLARSHGFNAITITGGEGCLPLTPHMFKDRNIVICYDNDGPGVQGAKRLALALTAYTTTIKVVTNFHEICCESGEDITDFFVKYGKTKEDLQNYIDNTPNYVPNPEDTQVYYPTVDLITASQANNINRLVRGNIQVIAVSDGTFATPTALIGEKYKLSGLADTLPKGAFQEWELTSKNAQDILHLLDNNFTEETISKNIRNLLHIPVKERCIRIKTLEKQTIFKASVTDMFETSVTDVTPMEYTAYSIGIKLESGKKYCIDYKLTPHPYKGQQLIMIIVNAEQATDSVSNFVITPEVKDNLQIFRNLTGSVAERITLLTEKVKGLLGYNGNNTLIQGIDLAYNTALQFNFGTFKNVRGYLDTIIVSESRVGKSSTAETLRNTYALGTMVSLAGNSATIPGLIGGSNKTSSGGFQTRAGIIPQNHRGLLIFEEFGKSNASVISELTDIRSSNEVRITRVSGTITLPAMVRMIALTNVKSTQGAIKPIASYPNGISIITELVDAAEDIARYDLILILSDRGNNQIDPFWEPSEPLSQQAYQTRIRWIWSRTPEQIIISREVGLYIVTKANELSQMYDCHIKIFGTEAWKKIARLSVAIAGYLVSTDDTCNNLIVQQEHVDYACNYMQCIYDNSTFKLKEYVTHERQYSTIDNDGILNLQDIYTQYPALVLQLEQCAVATRGMLGSASGLSNDDLSKALNRLTKGLFIRFSNYEIIPTERFRLGASEINRNTYARRIGE